MALPPVTAAPPADMPAPAPGSEGADVPMAGADEGASPWMPFVTVMKNSETGEFRLVEGDEPEDGEADGEVFKDGPMLLKAMMSKIEGGNGAEESFGKAFRGEPDAAPAKPAPAGGKPPMPVGAAA